LKLCLLAVHDVLLKLFRVHCRLQPSSLLFVYWRKEMAPSLQVRTPLNFSFIFVVAQFWSN
jgi:hypothetical protein